MSIEAISAIDTLATPVNKLDLAGFSTATDLTSNFFNLINDKIGMVDESIKKSDGLVEAYIKGENIPVHEIMIALGKAKTEIQLAVEIRNKLLESYQEITRIQL